MVVIGEYCIPLVAAGDLALVKRTCLADQLGSIHLQGDQDPKADLIRGQTGATRHPS